MQTGRNEFLVRDEAMADNIAWILEQNPHARMVVWAHNAHISRGKDWMGSHLAERFGDQYVAFGFTTAHGRYVAYANGTLGANELLEPPTGSIESFFDATGEPRLVLDLRLSKTTGPSGWLRERRMVRGIGAVATERQFAPHDVTQLWDALIYIRDTTPARQLHTRPGRH
jgi:erythromycin esterase